MNAPKGTTNGTASNWTAADGTTADGTTFVGDETDDFTLIHFNRLESPRRYICAICETASFAEAGLTLRHALNCKAERRPARTIDDDAVAYEPELKEDSDDGDAVPYVVDASDDEEDVFTQPTDLLKRRQVVKFVKSHNGKRDFGAEESLFHCIAYHQAKVNQQANRNKAHRAAEKRGREMAEAWFATREREVIVPRKENIPRLRELAEAHGADICVFRARPNGICKEIVTPIDLDSPQVVTTFFHDGRYFYITDMDRFVAADRCRHCKENIEYDNLARHELECGYDKATRAGHSMGPTKITHSKMMKKYKPAKTLFEKLQKEGALVDVKMEHFEPVHVVYDIETLAKEECALERDNLNRQVFPTGKHSIYHVSVSLHMGDEVYVGASGRSAQTTRTTAVFFKSIVCTAFKSTRFGRRKKRRESLQFSSRL